MPRLLRVPAIAVVLFFLAGCSSSAMLEAIDSVSTPLNGHVYLIRGLLGEIFSRGLDPLADTLNKRGIRASVHGLAATNSLAEEIIRKYREDPSSAPIILIGHSSGGDAIISMAQKMKNANVPVGLAFGFDPTPVAGPVPDNVEVFINLFQKTNPIGGGEIKAAPGFRGRLINVDMREHREIIHITLDKSSKLHQLVTDEILGFAAHASGLQTAVSMETPPKNKKQKQRPADTPAPSFIAPLLMKYVVPRDEPIEIWDSGLRATVREGDTLQTIAAQYGAPVWAIAQVNNIGDDNPLQPGMPLIIPQRLYKTDALLNGEPPQR